MTAPAAVLAAIDLISGRVMCVEMCGAIAVGYDQERDAPAIHHVFADCPNYLYPDSPAALALAEDVLDRLAGLIVLADYGERVLNVWEVA